MRSLRLKSQGSAASDMFTADSSRHARDASVTVEPAINVNLAKEVEITKASDDTAHMTASPK